MIRVILDTNVVLSALVFTSGRLAWMRRAWQQGQWQPLVCKETVNELLRVLSYPKFKLTDEDRQELLADFLPYTDVVDLPQPWPVLPACCDEKDQVFLVLAQVSKAQALVTGDSDLLAMREQFPDLIVTPEKWAELRAERTFEQPTSMLPLKPALLK
jgi:putative PIN family toxin of toxin-antitoxin system